MNRKAALMFVLIFTPAVCFAGISWQAAESKVKALPCKDGGTVEQCLDQKATLKVVEDLGWLTRPYQGGFEVERLMLLNGTTKLSYKWYVDSNGTVKPTNGKAIGITK